MSKLLINRQTAPSVLEVVTSPVSLSYVDLLQHQSAEDIAFYPRAALQKALDDNHILGCEENGSPAGYLWFGAVRTGLDIIIYQAAVDYDLRRQYLGLGMVRQLIAIAQAAHSSGIRLKCASSAASNVFWRAAGFYCTAVEAGGIKRQRDLNVYRKDLGGTMPQFAVKPSDKATDLRAYNKMKREGRVMPSRFSRSHYGILIPVGSEDDPEQLALDLT